MPVAVLIARTALAAVFVVAGVAKLLDQPGSRQAIKDFGLPARLAPALGLLLPGVELLVALALIVSATAWVGATAAAVLLLLFIVGMTVSLARGRTPDCHCFGQIHSAPIGPSALLRNVVLLGIALFVAIQGKREHVLGTTDWLGSLTPAAILGLAFGVVVLALLLGQAYIMLHLLQQNGRLLVRLEALEARHLGSTAALLDRLAVSSTSTDLLVSETAPDFSLPDIEGHQVRLADFRGETLLLIFWDTACSFCQSMLPELKAWEQSKPPVSPVILLFAAGEIDDVRGMGLRSAVIYDPTSSIATAYGARGTPTAVLVDADGRIASEVAAGSQAVFHLAGRTSSWDGQVSSQR